MAKVKEIKLGRGLSLELGGRWHKLYAEMGVELEKGDKEEEVIEQVWDSLDNTLKDKYDSIVDAYEEVNKKK